MPSSPSVWRDWGFSHSLPPALALLRAAKGALTKHVPAHTFRHSFASHLLQANYDIVTIQKLLGHSSVKTTVVYTQTVPSVTLKDAKSPLGL